MTLQNKMSQLPAEQLSWLLLIKNIFKRTFNSNVKHAGDLIKSIESKAKERGFNEMLALLSDKDLKEYFKSNY